MSLAECGEGPVRRSTVVAGTDEARYLAQLQTALSTGAGNPAEAIRSVRSLAGTELSVVLRQLGVIERQQAQR